MTTYRLDPRPISLLPVSSKEPELWDHPMLELFRDAEPAPFIQAPLLYSIISNFGEDFDPDFCPQPTSASDLPDLETWTLKFGRSVLEIYAAKRQPAQLARWCHRTIYSQLTQSVGTQSEVGRIRKLHQSEPLDGICESTITIRFGDRIRSLVLRFEGVDKRWLCTALNLL